MVSDLWTDDKAKKCYLFGGITFSVVSHSSIGIVLEYIKRCANAFTLHCSMSLGCTNEYLAIDTGGYLCMKCIHTLTAVRRNASREVKIVLD